MSPSSEDVTACGFDPVDLKTIEERVERQAIDDPGSIRRALDLAARGNWDGAAGRFLVYWRGQSDPDTAKLLLRYFPYALREGARRVDYSDPGIPDPQVEEREV